MTDASAAGAFDKRRTHGQWWQSTEPFVVLPIAEVERIGRLAYEAAGASPDDAAFLLATNLDKAIQGDHARGLGKLSGLLAAARAGSLDLAPTIETVDRGPAVAVVDGGPTASGRLVCRAAMDLAIAKAGDCGMALVGARASGELLTPYMRQATEAGMIGMAMVQSAPSVAPLGARGPLLGNAPVAVGIPAGDKAPLILDMSLTQSSASGVILAGQQGELTPPGVLLDEDGVPTRDASRFQDQQRAAEHGLMCLRGSLVPLGNSHKGYALVLVVGLLTSLLSDTDPPWELYYDLDERGRYGTLLWAIDPVRITGLPADEVGRRVDRFLERVKQAPPARDAEEGFDVLYPGERSQQLAAERRRAGRVSIPQSHAEELAALARELGIDEPRILASEDQT